MKATSVVIAALGGILVGATLGLLFAPDKGATTRSKIVAFLNAHGIKLSKDKIDAIVDEIEGEIEGSQA